MFFHRGQHAQITLHPSGVVIMDIGLNHLHKLPLAGKPSAVIAFPLQDAPEALHGAIVNAMCNTGHRAFSCRHRVSSQTKASDHPGTMLSGKWKPPIKKWPVRSKSCSPHNQ